MDLLLVEDEAAVANLYLQRFEKAGWRTHWVATAGAGVAAVLQRPYDAVLLDLLLKEGEGRPAGDGLDVLRALRAHGIQTPVIIQSSFATEAIASDVGELGVVTILEKPVSTKSLLLSLAAAAAAAAKTTHDPLAVAQQECSLVDCSVVCGSDVCLGILLRAIGDRALSLRSFAHLSEKIARLANHQAPDRAGLCPAIGEACGLRANTDRELDKILSVLAASEVAGARELARVCEVSVKAIRHRLINATGHGIARWRRMSRVRRFIFAIVTTRDQVAQCAHRAGYSNSQQASRDCDVVLGITAKRVRDLATPQQ